MSPLLLFILAVLSTIDASITTYLLSINEGWQEANPVLSYGISVFGLAFIWLFKATSLALLGLGIYLYKDAEWLENVLMILNIIYGFVVIYSIGLLI